MTMPPPLEPIDIRITTWMARNGVRLTRVSLGAIFLWFGALKFVPGWSPAQDLATRTIDVLSFGLIPPPVSLPVLATWEVLIGLGLLSGRALRTTILLLFVQMLGTFAPLVLFPDEAWVIAPLAPSLEGQYIIKNLVLISAGIVIGATVRGGRLHATSGRGRTGAPPG